MKTIAFLIFQIALIFQVEALTSGFSGPCVITQGGIYSGRWESDDYCVPAITINTNQLVIIQNSILKGKGDLIKVNTDGNVKIDNSIGIGLNPNIYGKSKGWFLLAGFASAVKVTNCYLEGVRGIRILGWMDETRGTYPSTNFIIKNNQAKNIDGRISDGNNGYLFDATGTDCDGRGSPGDGNFLSILDIKNSVGSEVAYNEIINEPNNSSAGDVIALYMANGKSNDPTKPDDQIRIHDNYIQGAYPYPSTLSYYYGGGILLGDAHPADCGKIQLRKEEYICRFIKAYNNFIVSTANKGIGIANGQYIDFSNNRIVSSGYFKDGSPIPSQMKPTSNEGDANSVGAYLFDYYNWDNAYHCTNGSLDFQTSSINFFKGNSASNNYIRWNKGEKSNPVMLQKGTPCCPANCSYQCAYTQKVIQCKDIDPSNNNNCSFDDNYRPTLADELAEYNLWKNRVKYEIIGTISKLVQLNSPFVYKNQSITASTNQTNWIYTNNSVELQDIVDVIIQPNSNSAVEIGIDVTAGYFPGNTSNNFCSPTANARIEAVETIKTNVDSTNGAFKLNIYPNPSSGKLAVKLGNYKDDLKVTILNSSGKIIWINNINFSISNEIEIDLQNNPDGLYFITAISSNLNLKEKFALSK